MIRKSGNRFFLATNARGVCAEIMLKQMSNAAKNLLRLLGASGLIMAAAVALNFVVDPLQIFRPARLFAAMYSQDSRMQDAGLIRSQDFDTVFMGTSLAIHFRQSDIDRILGVHSLKLSLNGSTSTEQNFVLAAALERHPQDRRGQPQPEGVAAGRRVRHGGPDLSWRPHPRAAASPGV